VCFGCRGLRPGRHLEDDDIGPELANTHPRERPDWEETISAMVRHTHTHTHRERLFCIYTNICTRETVAVLNTYIEIRNCFFAKCPALLSGQLQARSHERGTMSRESGPDFVAL